MLEEGENNKRVAPTSTQISFMSDAMIPDLGRDADVQQDDDSMDLYATNDIQGVDQGISFFTGATMQHAPHVAEQMAQTSAEEQQEDVMDQIQFLSSLFNVQLSPETLECCVHLMNIGVQPEALVDIVRAIRAQLDQQFAALANESNSASVAVNMDEAMQEGQSEPGFGAVGDSEESRRLGLSFGNFPLSLGQYLNNSDISENDED